MKPGKRVPTKTRGIWYRVQQDGTKVYGITYTTPDGKTVRKNVGPTKDLAQDALNAVRTDLARGAYHLSPAIRSPSFRAFSEQYMEHAKTEKKSWKLDEYCLKPLIAHFGKRTLDKVTPWSIEQYKAKRLETVGKRTVNIELSLLRRMFTLAVTWNKAKANPVVQVKRFREDEKTIRVLSDVEERRLLQCSPAHLRDLITLALNTGLRLGELRALCRKDVDLETGVIRVSQSKTGRVRFVPINATSKEVIERGLHSARNTILGYENEPIGNIHSTWYRATKAAKLEGFRIHDLRHTFATRMVLRGNDIATVAALLGHRTLQMTMRYAHPSPESKRAAVASLESGHHLPTKSKRATPK